MSNWQDVIERANTDPQFRIRLKSNPAAACKEAGVDVPAGATVKVIERRPTEIYLELDAIGSGELDDAELEAVAGGFDLNDIVKAVKSIFKPDFSPPTFPTPKGPCTQEGGGTTCGGPP